MCMCLCVVRFEPTTLKMLLALSSTTRRIRTEFSQKRCKSKVHFILAPVFLLLMLPSNGTPRTCRLSHVPGCRPRSDPAESDSPSPGKHRDLRRGPRCELACFPSNNPIQTAAGGPRSARSCRAVFLFARTQRNAT